MKRFAWLLDERWRVVWFLTLAAALNFGDRSAMSVVLPALQQDFGITNVLLGLLGSVFLWSYAIGSPLAGNLADRFSRSKMVIGSLIAWSTVTALMGLAAGYPMLLVLRIALGVTECLFLPAAVALIASYHGPETRARAMSFIQIGANSGMVVGGSVAGYFADHYGWRVGFFVLGGAGIALALFSRTLLPASAPRSATSARPASFTDAVNYILRVPSFYVLLGESMLSGVGMWIFFTWLPLYFRETFSMPMSAAGFAGTIMLQMWLVVGVLAGGWLSDRVAAHAPHRRMLLYACCYLLGAPCLLLFLGQPSFTVVAVGVSVFSFMRGLANANDNPTQCEIVPPEYRSTGVGLMNAVATAAGGCGVLMAGILKREVGLGGIFAGISLCFFAASALLFVGYHFFLRKDIARAQARAVAMRDTVSVG
ncbi:MFS transporter [Oleiharenicola lentus]|uniref:MFS transporter n=1 Tax=Oleiharenicola lentus TaxID=2508720 RepID=UPI003F66F806